MDDKKKKAMEEKKEHGLFSIKDAYKMVAKENKMMKSMKKAAPKPPAKPKKKTGKPMRKVRGGM